MTRTSRRLAGLASLAAVALMLTACGDSTATTSTQGLQAPAKNAAANASPQKPAKNPFHLVDTAGSPPKDHADYLEITSGNQIAFFYNAHAPEREDGEVIAKSIQFFNADEELADLASTISSTQDAFKRRDALTTFNAKVDTEIHKAANTQWIKTMIQLDNSQYDFDKQGFNLAGGLFFPINTPILNKAFVQVNDNYRYKLGFSNGPDIAFIPVPDEAQAREIQDLFARGRIIGMFYGQVGATQDSSISGRQSEQTRAVLMNVSSIKLIALDSLGQPGQLVYSHTY
jgi:hypothetical protein